MRSRRTHTDDPTGRRGFLKLGLGAGAAGAAFLSRAESGEARIVAAHTKPAQPAGSVGLLAGVTIPSKRIGKTGWFYIDEGNHVLYGPKGKSGWGRGFSLLGAVGATGPGGAGGETGATGPAGPSGTNGVLYPMLTGLGTPAATHTPEQDGQPYLDLDTGNLYLGSDGTWGQPVNVIPETVALLGTDGAVGGPAGSPLTPSLASVTPSTVQAQRYQTTVDGQNLLAQSAVAFGPVPNVNSPIIVQPDETFQDFLGVGAALTDSAANLLSQMDSDDLTALLSELFSPAQRGWGAVRICFGDSDFRTSANVRTYDDNNASPDPSLSNFSIGNDQNYIIPILQQILAINPNVRVFASIWYQPVWMNYTAYAAPTGLAAVGSTSGGSLAAGTYYYELTGISQDGTETAASGEVTATVGSGSSGSVALSWTALDGAVAYRIYRGSSSGAEDATIVVGPVTAHTDTGPTTAAGSPPSSTPNTTRAFDSGSYAVYAAYIVDAIQAYQAAGIPIFAVSPQNEDYVRFNTNQMTTLIGMYLGPALTAASLNTKLLAYDNQWVQGYTAAARLASWGSDPVAADYIDGWAWHGYTGVPASQSAIKRWFPDKDHYFTELRNLAADDNGHGTAATQTGNIAENAIVGPFRHWAKCSLLWNIALDESGGPITTGSTGRQGVVTINSGTFAVTRNPEYYCLSHISQFVKPGAVRCQSTSYAEPGGYDEIGGGVESVAWVNRDGSVVVFVYNAQAGNANVSVQDGRSGQAVSISMQGFEMSTLQWGTVAQDDGD